MRVNRSLLYFVAALVVGLDLQSASAQFTQTDLVSNVPGQAIITDPQLIDPWGISFSSGSPAWIANAGAGVATLYSGGAQSPFGTTKAGLVVSIPGPGGSGGTPTGTVFNTQSSGGQFNADAFLFSSLNGGIFGWRPALGTTAEILQTPSASTVYTGLAIANIPTSPLTSNTYAYAANFRGGTIDVLKGSVGTPNLTGFFTDPNLPAGYAPFNIQALNGKLFVTYAQQDASKNQPVAGPGMGFVDVFNLDGTAGLQNGLFRLVSHGALNAPFGLAIAPMGFGSFGGDLLVGNRGDGMINAYDPTTGAFIGTLTDAQGNPISNALLTALAFGNGNSFNSDALLFTAGDGVFGEIQVASTPLPAALSMFGSVVGAYSFVSWLRRKKRRVN
jgi:uncharacterized protein (TIGR03118 family)